MDTIVVATMPASGHVNPLLPVVSELTRSGVRTIVACTTEFEERIVRGAHRPGRCRVRSVPGRDADVS